MSKVIWNNDIDAYNPQVMPLSVARNIAKYLPIKDLLSFAQVSRNTYKAVRNHNLWVGKLKEMNLWNTAIDPGDGHIVLPRELSNPLTCMDTIYKVPKLARSQVISIYKALATYYYDLASNKPYDKLKLFKDFTTPQQQSLILRNLLRFNNIDYDDGSRTTIRDKISLLIEIFENALLRELEIHFDLGDYEKAGKFVDVLVDLQNDQTIIDFFIQKTILDNNEGMLNSESFDAEKAFTIADDEALSYTINPQFFDDIIEKIAEIFNKEAEIIDQLFPPKVPMMFKVCEELIANHLTDIFISIIEASRKKKLYLTMCPMLYEQLTTTLITKLKPCENMGPSYGHLVRELIDMAYESVAVEYMREELSVFRNNAQECIDEWKASIIKREEETTNNILQHVRLESKNDLLTSFRKVFTITGSSKTNAETEEKENYSEVQAKVKILSENIKSLGTTLSLEVATTILNDAKISLNHLLKFRDYTIAALRNDFFASMQELFITAIEAIGNDHLKPGFDKALRYLGTYSSSKVKEVAKETNNIVGQEEPLILFYELINMADLMIQMIDIFYKQEMRAKKIIAHENSILNPSLQKKNKLEGVVDNYVATGLNIGIEILVAQIENTFQNERTAADYDPPPNFVFEGPTKAARKVVDILDQNFDVLVDCAEKSVVEVFQQEIAERFFQAIVKSLKNSVVSVSGAINVIADLNLYYDFILTHIKTNKKMVLPLFQSLKKVGNLYLISGEDSKAIGKLVSDLSKFNGIFNQEEIYEFVQRRKDWLVVKKDVEKVMYGLGLGDCSIA
ncbi:hypothetical protein PGUG_03406 [Meyerozyma guilliermondii ATCC 6260]|uniref:F-box domain-containing protein n=1 Tax=Meyerozyma guilliermondii (strain ATCC 6260 / CBS 566 / DSM 6381 / JCM 1539 / NBRC 10279 / NRRL Y-324) TaxID=294746 RepID=A5DJF5_PICGU|nr:uncharacterized protein PGUG_03406 [Meyerozyma guilliermondii ATCC 6260]EDK39308.2 hypothetical protein PGUG_03406 [Meyerozyma guilliermondii ATCC 6260]